MVPLGYDFSYDAASITAPARREKDRCHVVVQCYTRHRENAVEPPKSGDCKTKIPLTSSISATETFSRPRDIISRELEKKHQAVSITPDSQIRSKFP